MIFDTMKYKIANDCSILTSKSKLEMFSNTKFNYGTIKCDRKNKSITCLNVQDRLNTFLDDIMLPSNSRCKVYKMGNFV